MNISIDLVKFDGFTSRHQDAITKVIRERLETNGFPGGGVKFSFARQAKEKTRLPGLYWRATKVPSEEIVVILDDMPNLGYVGYLMPMKSAKEAMRSDPRKRTLKDYVAPPVLSLPPKAGPATRLITSALIFEGVDDLSLSQEQPVVEEASVPVSKAEPMAKSPEQQKSSDKLEDRVSYGTNECMTSYFQDTILGQFLEHWAALNESDQKKGVLPAALTAAFENSHRREAGKTLRFQMMGKVLTKLATEGMLQKVNVNSVTNVYYPSDYKVGEKPAKRFRGPGKSKGKKPTTGKIEPSPEGVFSLTAETIRQVLNDNVEVSGLVKEHETKLQECEHEQKELEAEQALLRERLKTVTGRLSELKACHKDLGQEGQNLTHRQEVLKPLIDHINELRKVLG